MIQSGSQRNDITTTGSSWLLNGWSTCLRNSDFCGAFQENVKRVAGGIWQCKSKTCNRRSDSNRFQEMEKLIYEDSCPMPTVVQCREVWGRVPCCEEVLSKTNSSPLKIGFPKTRRSYSKPSMTSGAFAVSCREGSYGDDDHYHHDDEYVLFRTCLVHVFYKHTIVAVEK